MFAAKQIFLGRSAKAAPTAKSYVQDGLIAMWDGIENAGWGVHDAAATTWKDLTCNGYDFNLSTATFDEDSITVSGNSATLSKLISGSDIVTVEVNFKARTSGYCLLFFTSQKRLSCYSDRVQFGNLATSNCVKSSGATYSGIYSGNTVVSGYADGESRTLSVWTDWNGGTNGVLSVPNYYSVVGKLRNLRVYSRALTAAEIAANYAIDKERFNLP